MQPFFNAISHGCKAGLYQEALDEVYERKILRKNEHFITHKLGAYASNLACLANFSIDEGWQESSKDLREASQDFMLACSAFALRGAFE